MAPKRILIGLLVVLCCLKTGIAKAFATLEAERKRYLEAYCAYQREDFQRARQIFSLLLDEYPQLGDYVCHYLAQSQFVLGDYVGAQTSWQRLLELYPQSRWQQAAKLGQAKAYLRQGIYPAAAKLYRQLLLEGLDNDEDLGQAYLNYGLALEAMNQPVEAGALYQHLWFYYPASAFIPQAKERMEFLARKYQWCLPLDTEAHLWKRIKAWQQEKKYQQALDEIKRFNQLFPSSKLRPTVQFAGGRTHLNLGQRKQAIRSFRQILKNYPKSEQVTGCLYYLGKTYWNLGQDKKAVQFLNRLVKEYPHSAWIDETLYVLGRIHESNQSYSRAIKTYQRLVRSYPYSSWTDNGFWRMGWIHYQLENYPLAIKTFSQAQKKSLQSPWQEAILYWQGRALEQLGQLKKAFTTYQKLIDIANYTYYAQLAKQRLPRLNKGNSPFPSHRQIKSLPWRPPNANNLSPEVSFHLQRAEELIALCLESDLNAELDLLAGSSSKELNFWVYLSRAYQLAGNYKQSIRVLWRYLELKAWGLQQLPPEIQPFFYPRFFAEELEEQAQKYQLEPYLLAAIIRRESVFDPQAESNAGALGLMQIIPGTATKIARKLGDKNFQVEQLRNPYTNLRYGSYYFAQLLKRFQAKPVLALAAYNAGAENAYRWWKNKKNQGWEEFVENIPFPETRHYIRQVISNYNNYLLIYNGERKSGNGFTH